jgi:hypothetical protein
VETSFLKVAEYFSAAVLGVDEVGDGYREVWKMRAQNLQRYRRE